MCLNVTETRVRAYDDRAVRETPVYGYGQRTAGEAPAAATPTRCSHVHVRSWSWSSCRPVLRVVTCVRTAGEIATRASRAHRKLRAACGNDRREGGLKSVQTRSSQANWYDQDWVWHRQYDLKFGKPLAPAVRLSKYVWRREFESCTVTADLQRASGSFSWKHHGPAADAQASRPHAAAYRDCAARVRTAFASQCWAQPWEAACPCGRAKSWRPTRRVGVQP